MDKIDNKIKILKTIHVTLKLTVYNLYVLSKYTFII
jgi:hypothetical protein